MSPPGRTVVAFGSINVDRTARLERLPGAGETVVSSDLAVRPGGKSANQAVAAARLGSPSRLVAAVGDDPDGSSVLASIAARGVDVSRVTQVSGASTGQAVVLVEDSGENCIVVVPGANAMLTAAALDESTLADAGVLLLCLEVPASAVLAAAYQARAARVPVILNLSPSRPVPPSLLTCVDLLVVNQHELAGLTGTASGWEQNPESTLDRCGVTALIVTLGPNGALLLRRGAPTVHRPGIAVPAVDTTGCGDAFLGALASEVVRGSDLPRALTFAVGAGALAATRAGAQDSYPTHTELDALLSRRNDHTGASVTQADKAPPPR